MKQIIGLALIGISLLICVVSGDIKNFLSDAANEVLLAGAGSKEGEDVYSFSNYLHVVDMFRGSWADKINRAMPFGLFIVIFFIYKKMTADDSVGFISGWFRDLIPVLGITFFCVYAGPYVARATEWFAGINGVFKWITVVVFIIPFIAGAVYQTVMAVASLVGLLLLSLIISLPSCFGGPNVTSLADGGSGVVFIIILIVVLNTSATIAGNFVESFFGLNSRTSD